MTKTGLRGRSVSYDEKDTFGLEYLRDKIEHDEAEVIFDYAKDHGIAQFETQNGMNYSLIRNSDGTYTITRR